ncbi:Fluconazole resistance protein 1 [Saxophila tyrrhenica]|uniref:Fluconazole resistance protein 1 n=1 Tax=Saxophila tyrrhenica TaxID=1690608 RepID=A0AAV9PJ89_9PEZI|nr:Fluconazole resistance protein 1 [Saxophila tyrrhenica]
MSLPQRTDSTDSSADAIRKRVCKACDRCRLKKSKCDGSNPCNRCKTDNAICVFGERKKSHDKVYPKGYVEMLEQQQGQLVTGLQDMYRRLLSGEPWPGKQLSEANGQPLTHDILAGLGLLEARNDGSGEFEPFEEDFDKIQSRLLAGGADYVHRRGSFSSDSDRSQHTYGKSTAQSTPPVTKAPVFDKNFTLSASPSPAQSPAPRQRRSHPPALQSLLHSAPPLTNDGPMFQSEWYSEPKNMTRSNFGVKTPQLDQNVDQMNDMFGNPQWDDSLAPYELNMGVNGFPEQNSSFFGQYQPIPDYTSLASMDLDPDFNQFIQVAT